MGLNTTHDCWNGPCSSFNQFRYALARQIGIDLNDYTGYNNPAGKDLKTINHDLMPLFDHSDCDGELTVAECQKIVSGLNSILENLNTKLKAPYDFKELIITFRDGCLDAISKNESVEFH